MKRKPARFGLSNGVVEFRKLTAQTRLDTRLESVRLTIFYVNHSNEQRATQ